MGRGSSKAGGGGISKNDFQNIKGVNGYKVKTASGDNMEFFFEKGDNTTYYRNDLSELPRETPNNMTEKQMINALKQNGSSVEKYSDKQLVDMEKKRLTDKEKTNKFLDNIYARNKDADIGHKAYRNTKRANKISKRR